MAKVVYRPRIDLWRIVDGRNDKPLRTNYNRAVDNGGCRTEIDAHRVLRQYQDLPVPRAKRRKTEKAAKRKNELRLEQVARNVERQIEKMPSPYFKREGPGIVKAKP
jgi:hypothetical protein